MSIESYNIFGNSFEEQFARREKIETAGGTAEVVDVSSEHLKSEVPVFLATSWSMSFDVYEPLIHMLFDAERRVVSLNHPRVGGDINDYQEESAIYPKNELRKALTILDVIKEKNLEQVDALAHSESAINVSVAAMLHPEKFRSIVYYAPAGMIGEDTFSRLVEGFSKQGEVSPTLQEMNLPEPTQEVINLVKKEFLTYVAQNPIRAIGEVQDISKSQIHTLLKYLHQKGIKIAVMAAVDDLVFPMDRIQEMVKSDMLDGFLSVRGGHAISTEGPSFANGIDEMFTALEKKAV